MKLEERQRIEQVAQRPEAPAATRRSGAVAEDALLLSLVGLGLVGLYAMNQPRVRAASVSTANSSTYTGDLAYCRPAVSLPADGTIDCRVDGTSTNNDALKLNGYTSTIENGANGIEYVQYTDSAGNVAGYFLPNAQSDGQSTGLYVFYQPGIQNLQDRSRAIAGKFGSEINLQNGSYTFGGLTREVPLTQAQLDKLLASGGKGLDVPSISSTNPNPMLQQMSAGNAPFVELTIQQ